MTVSDHAINGLRIWFEMEYEELKLEYESGQYTKLSDCPSFAGAAAYREAMNVLIKSCYLPEYAEEYKVDPLRKLIKEGN